MPWLKMTDEFDDDVSLETMSAAAVALFLCGSTYCARKLTDGFISTDRAQRLPFSSPEAILMLCAGEKPWWVKVEGGYQIRSYLKYNPTKERVLADRAATSERVRRMREGQKEDVTPLQTPVQTPLVTPCGTPTSHIPYPISHIQEETQVVTSTDRQAKGESAVKIPPGEIVLPSAIEPETGGEPNLVTRPRPRRVGEILGKSNPLARFDPAALPKPDSEDADEIERKRRAIRQQAEAMQ
jgi:hypothetical protein